MVDIVICSRLFPSSPTQRALVELARVMVSVEERTVVTGGVLKGEKWVPDLDEAGDRKFLELNGSRSKLCAKFFGGGNHDACTAALNILKNARNKAVDHLLLEHDNAELDSSHGGEHEPLAELPLATKRHMFDSSLFPRIIKVGVHTRGEGGEDGEVNVSSMNMLF